MNYSIERIQDIVLIELSGDSWGGLDAYQLKDEVSAIIAMGSRRFLADFEEAHFVNSAGIGVLVACWVSIRNAEGEFKFCAIGPRVSRAFQVAGVAPLFDVSETRAEALAEFGVEQGKDGNSK
jgi:anti-anti-sigma factor